MTDEQIKQNAEEYIAKEYPTVPPLTKCAIAGIFAAGAHSRDEEIEELKEEIESLKENEKELFEGFKKRGTKLGELMKENVKLRNPQISVEKQLPEHKKPIIFKCADKAYGGWYNKEMKEFQTKAPDGTNWAMDNVKSWYYQI